jgi:hypothetical protein
VTYIVSDRRTGAQYYVNAANIKHLLSILSWRGTKRPIIGRKDIASAHLVADNKRIKIM